MPFRLRKDARTWFKDIESQLGSDAPLFDMYYFCLAVGLADGKKESFTTEDAAELVDYYPGEFKSRGRIIVAWFLSQELKSLGIAMHERKQVRKTIATLVDPLSLTFLSDTGMREINRYASRGFDRLREYFDEKPQKLETFLPRFHSLIGNCLAGMSQNADPVP